MHRRGLLGRASVRGGTRYTHTPYSRYRQEESFLGGCFPEVKAFGRTRPFDPREWYGKPWTLQALKRGAVSSLPVVVATCRAFRGASHKPHRIAGVINEVGYIASSRPVRNRLLDQRGGPVHKAELWVLSHESIPETYPDTCNNKIQSTVASSRMLRVICLSLKSHTREWRWQEFAHAGGKSGNGDENHGVECNSPPCLPAPMAALLQKQHVNKLSNHQRTGIYLALLLSGG